MVEARSTLFWFIVNYCKLILFSISVLILWHYIVTYIWLFGPLYELQSISHCCCWSVFVFIYLSIVKHTRYRTISQSKCYIHVPVNEWDNKQVEGVQLWAILLAGLRITITIIIIIIIIIVITIIIIIIIIIIIMIIIIIKIEIMINKIFQEGICFKNC